MLNLIPTPARKRAIREYWLRVCAVGLFLLGTGCMVIASLMLPTYVLLNNKLGEMQSLVDARAATAASYDAGATALRTAMVQANTLLNQSTTTVKATTLGTTLIELAGENVTLSSLTFSTAGGTTTLAIAGEAKDRVSLATFRDAIEEHPYYMTAELPLGSLVKDRDLLFTMNIVVAREP